jgi:hypothetical protein
MDEPSADEDATESAVSERNRRRKIHQLVNDFAIVRELVMRHRRQRRDSE